MDEKQDKWFFFQFVNKRNNIKKKTENLIRLAFVRKIMSLFLLLNQMYSKRVI